MKRLNATRIPKIKHSILKKLSEAIYNLGYHSFFFFDEYSLKDKYINFFFDDNKKAAVIKLLNIILDKNIADRIIDSNKYTHRSTSIYLSEEEFLRLYNTLVIKHDSNKVTDISTLQYKSSISQNILVYNIDPTTLVSPLSIELKASIKELFKYYSYIPEILVSLNEKTKEATIYLIHETGRDFSVSKSLMKLKEQAPILKNSLISSYKVTTTRSIKQIDLSIDQLRLLNEYLKSNDLII